MPRQIDVYSLRRRERPVETRSFPVGDDGEQFTLTLRAATIADQTLAAEAAQILTEDYITGSEIREAGPFPDPEVRLSKQLFMNAAVITEMQWPAVYTPIELVILFDKEPKVGEEVLLWAAELNRRREKSLEGPQKVLLDA